MLRTLLSRFGSVLAIAAGVLAGFLSWVLVLNLRAPLGGTYFTPPFALELGLVAALASAATSVLVARKLPR